MLYPWRLGHNPARGPGVRNPSKTKIIRKYCLACMGDDRRLVRECANSNCSLHKFRLGALPKKREQAVGASFSAGSTQVMSRGLDTCLLARCDFGASGGNRHGGGGKLDGWPAPWLGVFDDVAAHLAGTPRRTAPFPPLSRRGGAFIAKVPLGRRSQPSS